MIFVRFVFHCVVCNVYVLCFVLFRYLLFNFFMLFVYMYVRHIVVVCLNYVFVRYVGISVFVSFRFGSFRFVRLCCYFFLQLCHYSVRCIGIGLFRYASLSVCSSSFFLSKFCLL